jgi:hypothetical protein
VTGDARLLRTTSSLGRLAIIMLIAASTSLHAEEGTLAQRNACKPDVFRLCQQFIPDPTAITACLQRNTAHLNPDCKAVFESKPK